MKRFLILLFLIAVALLAWFYWPSDGKMEQRYVTEAVTRGPLTQTVSANGTLNPLVLVNVSSQISGIVRSIHADFNDRVAAGQVLLRLDPTLLEAQLKQSEANVGSARAALELAGVKERRLRELVAQDFAPRQELEIAEQARKAAAAQLAVAEAQAARDRANLDYTVIRSPVAGIVISRQVDVGQTVAASLQAPVLFQIARDLSRMQIHASFSEADIGNIHPGQVANFTVDAFPGRSFQGKVRQVRLNPATVQNVVTYNVVIDVDNPGLLLPGMTAYVGVIAAERKEVLKVPNAALRFRPGNAAVKKLEGGHKAAPPGSYRGSVVRLAGRELQQVPLLLGVSDGKYTEVLEGELREGEQLVIEDRQAASPTGQRGAPPIRL